MRDGVRLRTVLHLPVRGGPHATILMRTPYCFDNDDLKPVGAILNRRGYAFVAQQTRGICGSEGEYLPFVTDGWGALQDGYDTIEYAAAQSWCDGQVGTWGASAFGITQELAAGAYPPHLAAQVILVASNDLYPQAMFRGGGFLANLVEEWLDGQDALEYLDVIESQPLDGEFWAQSDVLARVEGITAPALFMGGWFDIFQEGTLAGFVARQHSAADPARGNCRVIIGPWTHTGYGQRQQGELTFPRNAMDLSDQLDLMLAFFDVHLQGATIDLGPPVQYYTMGDVDRRRAPGNEWRGADDWPPFELVYTPLYLHSHGALTWDAPVANETPLAYRADPADPIPTLGGQNLYWSAGPYDQRTIEARDDVLVFETAPLSEPLEITGPVAARLFLSSDAPDTDVVVRLCDVYPDGRSMLMLDGIRRARHRNSFEYEEFLVPGEVVPVDVDLWSISLILDAGHRLRISVSGSSAPRFDVNPNTAEPFRRNTYTQVANNELHFSPEHPSQLILPLRQ